MQASPVKLLELLGESKTIFKIPVYQRKYEWANEQLEQYFTDINRILDGDFAKGHFLGTVVYVQNELPDLMKERLLIDGQQRLTTTLLLLKAIMDTIKKEDKKSTKWKEIRDTYLINPYGQDDTKYKLMPVDTDKLSYYELMNDNETDSNIYRNYDLCIKYIESSRYEVEDIYKALSYLKIVYISLDQKENPQIIFESLNSTGLSLTPADLIRNFILMGLEYSEQTELYNNYWRRIENILPNRVISDFVRDYLTMEEGVVPNKSKVYEAFKNYYYINKFNSRDILIELVKYSEYYSMIINSNTGIREIDDQLKYINTIRNTVSYPYLLKLLDDYYYKKIIKTDELVDVLKIIVSYIYRRNICGIATNALNKIFASMSKEVKNRIEEGFSYVKAVEDYLMSRGGTGIFPRDDEFMKAFINNDMYIKSNNLARLTLHIIESSIHKEVVDIEQLSVEHILPQTLSNEWSIELGRNSHEIHSLYKNTIGNLTLTNYNSEMNNRSFTDKKKYYRDSNITITRDISLYEKWTDKEILERAENLFNIIKNIWKLPEDNYQNVAENRLLPHEEYWIKDEVLVTGHSPKVLIIGLERLSLSSWKEMLVTTCGYLYEVDEELFISLSQKTRFSNMIFEEKDKEKIRNPVKISSKVYIETNYSAKDIVSYVALLFEEYDMADNVYFEIK